jgi:hypothetical protein
MASREEKAFQSSLRQRIGMPEPEQTVADAWVAMEESLAGIQPQMEALLEAVKGDPVVEKAVGEATVGIAEAFEGAVAAIESVEELLQAEGLVDPDDDLLEPDDHGPDA